MVTNNFNNMDDILMADMDYIDLGGDKVEYVTLKIKKSEYVTKCYSCNSQDNILYDHSDGIIVCTNCGFVLGDIIDRSPEWNDFDNKDTARCSSVTDNFFPTASLSVGLGNIKNNMMSMLHTWNIMPYKERALQKVLRWIHTCCAKAKILKCVEDDAKILFKHVSESKHMSGMKKGKKRITRGGNHKSIIAACVFYACRRYKTSITHKEIGRLFDLDKKLVSKGCKNLGKILKNSNLKSHNNPSYPEYYIPRFCSSIGIIDKKYVDASVKVAINARRLDIASNHTSVALAVCSIYFVINHYKLDFNMNDLTENIDISKNTLNKTYLEFVEHDAMSSIILDDAKVDEVVEKIKQKRENMPIDKDLLLRGIQSDIRFRKSVSCVELNWSNVTLNNFSKIYKRDNVILNIS